MKARLDGIYSIDLPSGPPALPETPEHCWIVVQADIGPEGEQGADTFTFYVTTPSFLNDLGETPSRSTIVLKRFDWNAVEAEISQRCEKAKGKTWEALARQIEGHWEFDSYTES